MIQMTAHVTTLRLSTSDILVWGSLFNEDERDENTVPRLWTHVCG